MTDDIVILFCSIFFSAVDFIYFQSHIITLNSDQYNTVCKKLILKYPKLSDKKGKLNMYVCMHALIDGRFYIF